MRFAGQPTPAPRPDAPLARDRISIVTSTVLLVLAAVAWVSVVLSSLRGDDMMMTMAMPVTLAHGGAFVLSWGIMMTAMMLPSALPMIALYGTVHRGADASSPRGVPVAAFTLVYLVVWAASGAPVYLAHSFLMM